MRGELPLRVEVDAGDCETHSSYSYHAGGRVLSIATVLPERGLAVELISTYVGHPDTGTVATHLTLGPEGHPAQMHVERHDHDALDPVEDPRACAYDHAHQLIDTLTTAGHPASVKLDERSFVALEAVE